MQNLKCIFESIRCVVWRRLNVEEIFFLFSKEVYQWAAVVASNGSKNCKNENFRGKEIGQIRGSDGKWYA